MTPIDFTFIGKVLISQSQLSHIRKAYTHHFPENFEVFETELGRTAICTWVEDGKQIAKLGTTLRLREEL